MATPEINTIPSSINTLMASGKLDDANAFTELHLEDGRVLRVPTAQLATFLVLTPSPSDAAGSAVIPLIEERLEVGKRTVPTGIVRIRKGVEEFETALNEPLAVRTYDIERVILNQPVEVAPTVRSEGETTIYPLVEEQLVLTKQLILREEVRVTRRDTERRDTQTVVLRREHLIVEREPAK